MLLAFARLGVRLHAEPKRLREPPNRDRRDVMTERDQPLSEPRRALRRPPQRRLRIPPRAVFQQLLEIPLDLGIRLADRLVPRTRPPDPALLQPLPTLKLLKTTPQGRLPDTGRAHDRRDPTPPRRVSFDRRPHPPTALIQHAHLVQQAIALRDPSLIDHTNQFCITPPTPPLTKKRALSAAHSTKPGPYQLCLNTTVDISQVVFAPVDALALGVAPWPTSWSSASSSMSEVFEILLGTVKPVPPPSVSPNPEST